MLTMTAWTGDSYLCAREIFEALGDEFKLRVWLVQVKDAGMQPGAEALEHLDRENAIPYHQLLAMLHPGVQIVDGELVGLTTENSDRIVLRAVDGSHWDLETKDDRVLELAEDRFPAWKKAG